MSRIEPDWNNIIEDLGPSLYRYFSGNFAAQIASDLVQETCIRLVQKHRVGAFDPSRGSIKTYAFGIARFIRLEARKSRMGYDLVDDDAFENVQAPSNLDISDSVAHLRWAILQLKMIEQEVILLVIDAEMTVENIATTLDIPVGTVKSHIHRAKENLRSIMEVC